MSVHRIMSSNISCHLCGGTLRFLDSSTQFRQVTSDCKPWPVGGQKACCTACGTVQAVIDDAWKRACHEIYSSYTVYHQSGGKEQPVFAADSNAGSPRSLELLKRMTQKIELPMEGRALDIGCGNGNFIRSFSILRPQWRLNGAEYNAIYEKEVLAIAGVEGFYSGELGTIPGPFDFVSLIHVLEHIQDPVPFLKKIAALAPGALLLIEVPFFHDNPYELLIADHATHYTPRTLQAILHRAGYAVRSISTEWIAKEISAVASVSQADSFPGAIDSMKELAAARKAVDFLSRVLEAARDLRSRSKSLGVFGTSIGGTWLFSELNGMVDFYVDEDASRVGKQHLGVKIVRPDQVPKESIVFMPLAPSVARYVVKRLQPTSAGTYFFVDAA